jgi:hypothetical protein
VVLAGVWKMMFGCFGAERVMGWRDRPSSPGAEELKAKLTVEAVS